MSPTRPHIKEERMAKKRAALVLPRTLRVFVNEQGRGGRESFLHLCESAEDAYLSTEGENVVVGVYELKKKVKLRFEVHEDPA